MSVLQLSRLRLSDQRCVYLGIFYLDRDDECLRGRVLCEQVGTRSKGKRGGADGGLSGGKACSEARVHSANCLIQGPEDLRLISA